MHSGRGGGGGDGVEVSIDDENRKLNRKKRRIRKKSKARKSRTKVKKFSLRSFRLISISHFQKRLKQVCFVNLIGVYIRQHKCDDTSTRTILAVKISKVDSCSGLFVF